MPHADTITTRLLTGTDVRVRRHLARNPNLHQMQQVANTLSNDPSLLVRRDLASNLNR
jgi:uncharacterized protein (DUF2336 family)